MTRDRKVRFALLGGSLVLLFLAAQLAWPVLEAAFEFSSHVAWQRSAIAKYHAAFLDDQELAARLPLLAPRPGGHDAGPLLAARLAPAAIGPALAQGLGAAWLEADPSLWAGLDFSWMAGLRACDHWDVDSVETSGQSFASVLAWAKLRLAKGLREGGAGPAIADVEELARLAASAERPHLVLTGITLLSYANRARERAKLPAEGPRVDDAIASRLVRATQASMAYTRLHTTPTYDADAGRTALGRCAALGDGLYTALVVRPYLLASHAAEYARLGRLLAEAGDCRLADLRRRWTAPDRPRSPPEPIPDLNPVLDALMRLAPDLLVGEWALSRVEPTEAELFGGYVTRPGLDPVRWTG